MKRQITFRPITEQDVEFLQRVYFSTRAQEMTMVPWSDEEKQEFLQMQFNAQHTYYQQHFTQARFDIVMADGQPIGRLYVDRRDDELRIIDIALLPEARGQGIGGSIMQDLIDEATAAGTAVTIHVERNNPAMHLYDRLGFQKIEDQGVYFLMQRTPGASPDSQSSVLNRSISSHTEN